MRNPRYRPFPKGSRQVGFGVFAGGLAKDGGELLSLDHADFVDSIISKK